MMRRLALLCLLGFASHGALSAPASDAAPNTQKQCGGNKISLNLVDVPVASVLQLLANFSGYKLAADPAISARGAFQYRCVAWDEVLQDVAARHHLSVKIEHQTIVVRQG